MSGLVDRALEGFRKIFSGDPELADVVFENSGTREAVERLEKKRAADLAEKKRRISELEKLHGEAVQDGHPLTAAYSKARRALEEFNKKADEERTKLQRAADDAESRMHAHRDGIAEELRELSVSVQMHEQTERMAQERAQREAEHSGSFGFERPRA